MDNQLILALLDLDDIEIINVQFTSDRKLRVCVKSTKEEIACHRCGGPTKPYGHGHPLQLRHLHIFGKETIIEITPPRGICEQCDDHPTTTQILSWYKRNSRYTKAYEAHILLSLIHSTIADVSIKENICEESIQLIIDKSISEDIDWKPIKKLGILGIDEISLKKGHKDFLSLVTRCVDGERVHHKKV